MNSPSVKVKVSHYTPGQVLSGLQISRHSAHIGGTLRHILVVRYGTYWWYATAQIGGTLRNGSLYLPENIPVTCFC
jgi:hypothetical protein